MNAKQLKDSILQYAMEGKLVSQDPNDEPASELLKRIAAEKERLIKEGILKKEKPLPPIAEEEKPFDIPKSWEWERLGNVIQLINGRAYKKNELLDNMNLTPVLRVGNLFTNNSWYYSDLELPEDKYCNRGDLLYAWSASFGPHIWQGTKVIYHYHIWKIRLFEEKMKEYIYYHLLKDANEIQRSTTGSTMIHITKGRMEQMLIAVPPLNEQFRILERLKMLENKFNNLENIFLEKKQLENMFPTSLEKSILQYAIQGKLVDQDPNDEPAQQLIEKIQLEKERLIKDKVIKKEKTLPPITEEEIPYDIPNSWEWVRLGEVCNINPKNSADDELDVGFIPMRLIQDGAVNKHTYEQRKWKEIKKGYTHFQDEDIVVAKITPCFENRKSAIIKNLPNGIGAGTTELIVFRNYSELIDKEYLLWIFKSNDFINGGKKSFTGTAGQQRVAKSYIENYLIPLPPQKEQKRIVQAIYKMMNLKERL